MAVRRTNGTRMLFGLPLSMQGFGLLLAVLLLAGLLCVAVTQWLQSSA